MHYINLFFAKTALTNLYTSNFDILLKRLPRNKFTAITILNIIRIKLSLGFKMDQLIKSLTISLNKSMRQRRLFGYKLRFAGRYKKSSRTNLYYKKMGLISNSTSNYPIDYAFTVYKSRFGVTGVKVWLYHRV